jgi:hypothetical protein
LTEQGIDPTEFEGILDSLCSELTAEAATSPFDTSPHFEARVRELLSELAARPGLEIDFDPHPQAFPDIAVGRMGVEVKFTTNDVWRSIANSVLETNRIDDVDDIYVVFGKMGGAPEVRWGRYEDCVMHVRTSHVPRFEVELYPDRSLFDMMGIPYADFHRLPMSEKMRHIRLYARGRLRPGERLWWLEDADEPQHSLPLEVRLYTSLGREERDRVRAEAAILCPQVVKPGSARHKYDDAVLYLVTYHGILCHQGRDLFSAGSVANPENDDLGGVYIERALKLLESEMIAAADRLEEALFVEYWGVSVPKAERLAHWLAMADGYARDWHPSGSLFVDRQVDAPHLMGPPATL